MQTPFGDLDVVDAHAHFFSRKFFLTLASSLPNPAASRDDQDAMSVLGRMLPFDLPSEDPRELAARWVSELDRHGVSRSVLIASVPGDEESVAAAAGAHPDRFIPYFMVNPRAADALDRTRRGFRELGFRGLCLFPAMHHFHLWEDALVPILEEAASHRAIVFVHCGILKVGIRDKLGLKSPFEIRYASPLDVAGAARRFDSISFVIPHFGGGLFRELLLAASESGNVFTDTSSSNSWMEKLPESLTLKRVFERAISVMGAERILYGSDSSFFPRGFVRDHLERQMKVMEELALDRAPAAAILGGNLSRLVERKS
jgi:uncharacterized protein